MTPEHWKAVYPLFNEAVDLPKDARASYLDAAGAAPAVRREVERLLAVYDADPEYLETPVGRVPEPPEPPAAAGLRVGPYRLIRRLGTGGMGAVYLAARDDDQYRQEVAVKLVKRGMDTEEILRRFRAERQILASLEHPHIARLLDGGMTDDGRPYVVMEYVDGAPLDLYCDRRRLSIPERLVLFRTVCDAVQFAHQNLVVHRDLKPSNIQVANRGRVKLLDFGIAKLLDPDRAAVTVPLTRTDVRPMTPDYASPEQVRGEAVSTTSDVYQLGVVLYELLTGRRPYRLHERTTAEITRIVCEQSPEKPSAVVRRAAPDASRSPDSVAADRSTDPERLSRRLAGDLDTIVLKALHKDPARRYASAEALADDLGRFLDGRPVLARPDTARYRFGKFVRRNRLGVGAAATFLVLLAAFGLVSAWQARALAVERDAARAERDKAERVVQVLVDLFETSNPRVVPGGDTLRVGEFLARGEASLFDGLADQPEVQAHLKHVVGKIYAVRSQFDRARPLLEAAAADHARLAGPDAPDALAAFHDLAVLAHKTNAPEAEALLRESLARHRQRYGDRGERVAQCLEDLAAAIRNEAEQEALLQRALRIRRAAAPAHGDEGLATGLSGLAALRYNQKDFDEAVRLWQDALDLLGRRHSESHPHVLSVLNNLAAAYTNQRRFDEAESLRRRVLTLNRTVMGPRSAEVGTSQSNLGVLLTRKGDPAGAEAAFRAALDVWRVVFPDDHWRTANDLRNLGILLQLQGRPAEGLPYLREALAVNRRLYGADSPQAGYVEGQLGVLLLHLGRTDDGLAYLRTALPRVEATEAGGASALVADTRLRLALGLLETGAFARAEPLFRQVLTTRQALFPADDPRVAEAQCGLGAALAAGDTPETGLALLRTALPRYADWGQADALLLAHAHSIVDRRF